MGKAFRSAAVRSGDSELLTHDKLVELVRDFPEKGKTWAAMTDDGDVPGLMEDGEWIKYATRLRHRAAARLADEGTVPVMDKRGRKVVDVKLRSGTLQTIKLEEGIIDWNLLDETGTPTRWDRAKAADLLDGLHDAIRAILQELIGSGAKGLTDEVEDENGRTTTEGEG